METFVAIKKIDAIYSCMKYVTKPMKKKLMSSPGIPFCSGSNCMSKTRRVSRCSAETVFECKIEIEEEVRQRKKLPYFKSFHNLRQFENAVKKKAIMNIKANLYCHFYTHVFQNLYQNTWLWQGLWWFHDIPSSLLITLTIWFFLLLNILQDM